MKTLVNILTDRVSKELSSWMRGRRGSIAVEFVIGSLLIVTTVVVSLDVYQLISARSTALRAATTMAEYVSQEDSPSLTFIEDLAAFSYRHEIAMPSEVAFVISAVSRPAATDTEPDPAVELDWNERVVVGEDPDSPPVTLGASCSTLGTDVEPGWLTALAMEPGDMVVAVEVCVKLLPAAFVSGGWLPADVFPTLFYHQQVLSVRGDQVPRAPA